MYTYNYLYRFSILAGVDDRCVLKLSSRYQNNSTRSTRLSSVDSIDKLVNLVANGGFASIRDSSDRCRSNLSAKRKHESNNRNRFKARFENANFRRSARKVNRTRLMVGFLRRTRNYDGHGVGNRTTCVLSLSLVTFEGPWSTSWRLAEKGRSNANRLERPVVASGTASSAPLFGLNIRTDSPPIPLVQGLLRF